MALDAKGGIPETETEKESRVCAQDVIEEVEGLNVFDEIDVDETNDIEYLCIEGVDFNWVPEWHIDEGRSDSGDDDDNVDDTGGENGKRKLCQKSIDIYREEDASSDSQTYMADGMGLDTEGSDPEEDDLPLEYDNEPLEEITHVGERLSNKPLLILGMTFVDKEELKYTLDRYRVENGVNLRVVRSTKSLMRVVCDEGCSFLLFASRDGSNIGFKIKTLWNEHSYVRVYNNRRASIKWLASQIKEKVQEAPKLKIAEMRKEIEREFKVHVSSHKCKRAKRRMMQDMEGSFKDEFGKLEAYCNELRISNPGSDVSVELSDEELENERRVFIRMYLCLHASKVGWRQECRLLIGVYGTFLKGKTKGILLTVVGIDANDSLYPLAFWLAQRIGCNGLGSYNGCNGR